VERERDSVRRDVTAFAKRVREAFVDVAPLFDERARGAIERHLSAVSL
jgi:hypothetical protein